jgi:hypothetical protein
MRLPLRFAVLLALLALGVSPALADPPHIEQVHIGLPGPNNSHLSRNGVWAPVFVRLTAGEGGNARNEYQLVVVTTDFDEAPYHFRTPVPALSEKEQRTILSYVHPGGSGSEFAVRLETADGEEVQKVERLQRGLAEVLEPRQILFLAVGAKLPALRQALEAIDQKKLKQQQQQQPDVGVVAVGPEGPEQHRMAYLEGVDEMPDRWFGYDAADVLVLSTSNARGFVEPLLEAGATEQRNALLGWVRRGGTVVLSVGSNHQEVARLLTMLPLLDVEITGGERRSSLPVVSHWSQSPGQPLREPIEVAKVKPGPGVKVLVREHVAPGGLGESPMVMQGSCGLGRVVLVAFDVDTEPFTAWPGQGDFWARIEELAGPRAPLPQTAVQQFAPGQYTSDELAGDLKTGLEVFQDVPVISFGWVALFILFYIVIVGPLDYLVLKKLFKRPELTWVTFPAVVIVVSVLAYVVAYSVKGDELRINKVDLIEYDLHEPRQAYGTAWFTLFSPRMQNYTLAVEPAAPQWVGGPPAGAQGVNVLSLLEGGGDSLSTGSTSLFQQPYEYTEDASGLKKIPIPVWATQSFTASWVGSLPKEDEELPVAVDLHASRIKEGVLSGSVINHLPVELQGLTLFYDGKWYALGDEPLGPGEKRNVGPFFERIGAGKPLAEWFRGQSLSPGAPSDPSGRRVTQGQLSLLSSHLAMQRILFYEASPEQVPSNSGLRQFDQTWRLREQREFQSRERPAHRAEAILVARAPLYMGPAEELEGQDRSPSRLWLGELPGEGKERPATPGHLFQETYLRIFAPVK